MTIKQIICALRGHGGVTFQERTDSRNRRYIDWCCKRCGRAWSEHHD